MGKPIVLPNFLPCITTPEILYALPNSLFASSILPCSKKLRITLLDVIISSTFISSTIVVSINFDKV